MPQDCILAASVGYDLDTVKPFFLSLRRSGYAGKICIFHRDLPRQAQILLARLGVELYGFLYTPGPDGDPLTVTGGRFLLFRKFLSENPGAFGRIMLTDLRDVVFQADPFAALPEGELHVFLEDRRLSFGSEPYNDGWMAKAFGPETLRGLHGKPISCVGTSIGSEAGMRRYLDLLAEKMASIVPDFFGSDQAAHNLLLHEGSLPDARVHPNGCVVLTMGGMRPEDIRTDSQGRVLDDASEPIPVLHQYDRHPELQQTILAHLS